VLAAGLSLPGCRHTGDKPPPPDARRPEIKTKAELAGERAANVTAGKVVPTSSPVVLSADRQQRRTPSRSRPTLLRPAPGAIEADIPMVDDSVLTVAEVLYPLRDQLEELRRTRTHGGFLDEARRLIRRRTQQEVGTLLIYREALSQLEEQQRTILDTYVDKELENLTTHRFGGSEARREAHLREYGLTKEQLRESIARGMIVQQYTREKLMPQVQVPRDALLEYYRTNIARYATPETRELLLIELPFQKFLPEDQSWERAGRSARAQARLKATRRARAAAEALAEKPFGQVAAEYSLGLHADSSGSWGQIGRPLQSPYDAVSRLVFEYEEGQVSEPIETETGWYIVKCGRIQPASRRSFVEVQDEIRNELMERRFNRLSADYVVGLAVNATISSLDSFIEAAMRRVDELTAASAGD